MTAGPSVMDSALIPCPAALTDTPVASEDDVAMTAEALARMGGLPIAAAAQPGDGRVRPATAAEEAGLDGFPQGSV